jgi:predicted O-methyltransferase YrrM
MKSLVLTPDLYRYILDMSPQEEEPLQTLRIQNDALDCGQLRSTTEQMHFIRFLLQLIRPKKILELGTFTGYMTLAMALATPETTTIISCDRDHIFPKLAFDAWQAAGVVARIEFFLGPALATLDQLYSRQEAFDFVYIDADKENSIAYFDKSLSMLQDSGVIVVDNILWKGKVVDQAQNSNSTIAIRNFNQYLKTRSDLHYCLLPIADGMALIRRR